MSLIAAALKPRSILIATDFSEASEKALRYTDCELSFRESRHSTEAHANNSVASVASRFNPDSRVRSEVVDESVSRRRPDE